MSLDERAIRLLHEWLAAKRSTVSAPKDRELLHGVRTRTNEDAAITDLERVATRHTDRVEQIEQVLAIVLEEILERTPMPHVAAAQPLDRATPYRGVAGRSVPTGYFACRSCGVVRPDSQACSNADGRYCVSCFEP